MFTCSGLIGVMKKSFKNKDQSVEEPIVVSDSDFDADGIKVQSLKEYGCGADVLFSMSNNTSYAARFLTQQDFPGLPIVVGF